MRRSRCAEDSGLAALEFVLIYLVVFLLLALSIPLVIALQERVRLERVAGHTARFATAAPDRPRYGSEQRRPTVGDVAIEANRAYDAIGADAAADFPVSVTASCNCFRDPDLTLATAHPGDQITITFTKTVNLGPIGALMDVIGIITSSNIDMTVTAVGRKE